MDDEEDAHLWSLVEKRSSQDDNVALNILGSLFVDRALRENDVDLLDVAQKKFERAAQLGNISARVFMESTWPQLKAEYAIEIVRRKNAA